MRVHCFDGCSLNHTSSDTVSRPLVNRRLGRKRTAQCSLKCQDPRGFSKIKASVVVGARGLLKSYANIVPEDAPPATTHSGAHMQTRMLGQPWSETGASLSAIAEPTASADTLVHAWPQPTASRKKV